jgi:hypothetical protein
LALGLSCKRAAIVLGANPFNQKSQAFGFGTDVSSFFLIAASCFFMTDLTRLSIMDLRIDASHPRRISVLDRFTYTSQQPFPGSSLITEMPSELSR